MAQYNCGISTVRIHDTRSLLNDTLVGSMSLTVYNAAGSLHHAWPNQTVQLGDHKKETTVQTNVLYENVDVPDPTSSAPDGGSISWAFLLVNKGHPDSVFLDTLKFGVDTLSGQLKQQGLKELSLTSLLELAGSFGLVEVFKLFTANCDGNVAALTFNLTAAELAQMTADPTNRFQTKLCPGTDSPVGCGSNSKYTLSYSTIPATTTPVLAPQPAVANFGYADEAGGWRVDKHPRFLADLTGDGRADIVGFGEAGVYVILNKDPGAAV
jgi:hypothetical protein